MSGLSMAAMSRHKAVRKGESRYTTIGLPDLTTFTPACGPLWRLFDGEPMSPVVRRQVAALCSRCGLRNNCSGRVTG